MSTKLTFTLQTSEKIMVLFSALFPRWLSQAGHAAIIYQDLGTVSLAARKALVLEPLVCCWAWFAILWAVSQTVNFR